MSATVAFAAASSFPGSALNTASCAPAAAQTTSCLSSASSAKAEALTGEKLKRAEPRLIRDRTGFAIGGVSPIGHMAEIPAFAEEALLAHDVVWAAAGAHDAVFNAEPGKLLTAAKAMVADIIE